MLRPVWLLRPAGHVGLAPHHEEHKDGLALVELGKTQGGSARGRPARRLTRAPLGEPCLGWLAAHLRTHKTDRALRRREDLVDVESGLYRRCTSCAGPCAAHGEGVDQRGPGVIVIFSPREGRFAYSELPGAGRRGRRGPADSPADGPRRQRVVAPACVAPASVVARGWRCGWLAVRAGASSGRCAVRCSAFRSVPIAGRHRAFWICGLRAGRGFWGVRAPDGSARRMIAGLEPVLADRCGGGGGVAVGGRRCAYRMRFVLCLHRMRFVPCLRRFRCFV